MRTVFVVLLFTLSFTAYSATYYIDPSGQDASTRSGSGTSPWKTLAYACSRVKSAGDIIHVNPGIYYENVQSILVAGVSIEGEGVNSNIISGISRLNTFTILLSSNAEATDGRQHISNIKMDGNSMVAYGGIRVAYRKNVAIYNCTFVNFKYCGVSFINGEPPSIYATGNKFHDNTMTNCSGYFSGTFGSLEIQGQDGMQIYNNNISLNRSDGLNGDIIYGVEGYLKNVKIYNNVLNKTYIKGLTAWDFAIEFWSCLGGVEIYDNTITGSIDLVNSSRGSSSYSVWIHDNTIGQTALLSSESVRGILLEANESDIIIERNLIRNVAAGIYSDQIGSGRTVSNISINSNIFSNIGVSDSGSDSKGWGIIWTEETYKNHIVSNISICNNVLLGHIGSRSTMWGINLPHIGTAKNITIRNNIIRDFDYTPVYAYTQTGSETIDVLSIENNIFYQNGNNNLPGYSGITPSNNTTRNNITSNPLFVSTSDYHLQPGSPGIGKGLKITGVTKDFDGKTYSDPPSIGAFEYFVAITPLYQSSVIENAAPSVLEMRFSTTLANIVPATGSFSVLVNAVSRGVNSAEISGTKILLTLASPVTAGDKVLISYTKPSVNPVQTPSEGLAENITSKSVTNNVVPVLPVYTGSVINNLTPDLLEMTFSLSLTNVIPSVSAFSVLVNSGNRIVNSVAISGNKVKLTLSSPVKFGDIVTISYTKPATNPLQGALAAEIGNIAEKPVTNNIADIAKPNDPPVVLISSDVSCFSGFIGVIDASQTHDPNNDALVYQWTVPSGIPVSSTSGSKLSFLAPKVSSVETIGFILEVSDGSSIVSKTISITIEPYKPELSRIKVADVIASDYEETYYPLNILDGDYSTSWTISGDNQWLLLKPSGLAKISFIEITFNRDQQYSSTFDIYVSSDNITWEPVLIEATSCNFSGDVQVFEFPETHAGIDYSFIKLIGHGNSLNDMNIISEFTVYGTQSDDLNLRRDVNIYPNPAMDVLHISVGEETIFPKTIRIYDLTGKKVFESDYQSGLIDIQFPPFIKPGVYIVNLCSGSLTLYAQQIIINR